MSDPGIDMDTAVFAALLQSAQLTLPPDRIDALSAVGIASLGMVRRVSEVDLGETPPATAFNASWE
jgi:hypothetical protein